MYTIPISNEPVQIQYFKFMGGDYTFTLRFNSISSLWNFDLFDNKTDRFICESLGLAVNAPSLLQANVPFIVTMFDESGLGIDSTSINDLVGRIQIYLIDKDEWHAAIYQTIQASNRQ